MAAWYGKTLPYVAQMVIHCSWSFIGAATRMGCQLSYIGSTAVQMFVRTAQHKGESFRTKLPLTKTSIFRIYYHAIKMPMLLKVF